MAKKKTKTKGKKVRAGEGKYTAAEKAFSTKNEGAEDGERESWENADLDSEQAFLLHDWIDNVYDKQGHGRRESTALLQLYHQTPSEYPDTMVGKPLTWDQLKKLGRNIMAKAADTTVSRLMKPVSVQISTVDGDFRQDIAARQANKAVKGALADNDALQKETMMVYDGWLTHRGKGFAIWEADSDGNPVLARLDPFYTWVSKDGKAATCRRFMPRREVLARYGKTADHREAILGADEAHPQAIAGVDDVDEMDLEDEIAVDFGWVEKRGSRKAWQVVQLDADTVLVNKEWSRVLHPIWWINSTAGFREGSAKPEGRAVAPYSYWINQLQQNLWHELSTNKPWLFEEEGVTAHVPTDVIFQRVKVPQGRMNAIKVEIPDTVSPHIERNIEKLEEAALGEKGVNEASAEGTIPGGVTAGVAITKYQNEVAIRLSQNAHNLNIGRLRSVRILCYLLAEVAKEKPLLVKADNSDDMESVSWPALNMKENTWSVVIQTAGALPDSVAGKAQMLGTFQEMGLADSVDIAEAYDNPDVKRFLDDKTTPRQLIRLQISKCLDQEDPKIFGPDETQDPKDGTYRTALAYQKARLKGKYPRANMDALFRLHLLFKNRVKMPATPGSISAPTAPLAGGGTNPAQAGAAGMATVGAEPLGTDVATQAAAATTGATGVI